jgi:dTDP-4-dehydrorhamnose 3,5-epimerase
MSEERGRIPGVVFRKLVRHQDARGGFAEAWRVRGAAGIDPFPAVQANLSSSAQGVLRGLHLHRRQSDLCIVVSGVAFVALVDVRPMLSGDHDIPIVETATLARDDTVVIPPHVAHGFLAIEPLELLYLVTNEYDASDELGFAWDDPEASVLWPQLATPDGRPIISERDQKNVSVRELVSGLRS